MILDGVLAFSLVAAFKYRYSGTTPTLLLRVRSHWAEEVICHGQAVGFMYSRNHTVHFRIEADILIVKSCLFENTKQLRIHILFKLLIFEGNHKEKNL